MKHITWTEDLDVFLLREVTRVEPFAADHGELLPRWKLVANALLEEEPRMNLRSAREHFEILMKNFKATDEAQRSSSGAEEYVTEKVQLMQDIVMRIDEVKNSKKRKHLSENARKDLLESTGEKLCNEAEIRVAKRSKHTHESNQEICSESALTDLLEFERKRHEDEHEYRMERLKLEKEEQQLRRSKTTQMENIIVSRQQGKD
ncbi:hypothetical protein AC1031_018638 [Aphanomyces cochlioides]|nr:hypothetical protein AC1031_018638 [Aphanomyces cochlioides]